MSRYYPNQKRKVKVVKKGGFFGKFVSFLLGVFMGASAVVGGIAGVGYYVATKPVGNTVQKVDKYASTDFYKTLFGGVDENGKPINGMLNDKYAKMTVEEMVADVTETMQALSEDGTLADVNEISPLVEKYVDSLLNKTAEYAISLDKTTVMSKPLKELPDYLLTQAKNTPLGDLLASANLMKKDALFYALFYGEEGVDYVMKDGKPEMLPGKTPLTIDSFSTLGLNGILDSISLESVAGDKLDVTDAVACVLLYGAAHRYQIKDGKAVMKQMAYVLDDRGSGAKLYDDNGNEVKGTLVGDKLTLEGGSVQYLQTATTSDNSFASDAIAAGKVVYHVFYDENKEQKALYPKTSISSLTGNPMGMLDSITLDTFFPVNKDTHTVLLSMMFGSDGYYFDESGNPVPTAPCKTISELRTNSANLINEIYLKDVLPVTASSPSVMLYLAYGEKGVDYTIDPNTNEIICANPRTFGDLSTNSDSIINDLPLKEALGVNSKSHPVVIALAYGTKGKDYTIENKGVDEEGDGDTLTIVPAIGATTRKLSDLLGSGSTTLFNELQLADALGLNSGSHKILLSLAFGSGGYTFDNNGDAVAKDGAIVTTLGMLSGSGSQTLIESLYLADALGLNKQSHPILLSLAFGSDGYTFDETTGEAIAKDGVTPTLLSGLMGSGASSLIENIYLHDALDLKQGAHDVLLTLAFGSNGYEFDENGKAVPKDGVTPHKLSDLMGNGSGEIINKIALTDLIKPTNPEEDLFVMFLLYGKKDVRYELDANKNVIMKQQWICQEGGKLYNEYGDELVDHTLVGNVYTTADGQSYQTEAGTVTVNGATKNVYLLLNADGSKKLFPVTKLGDIVGDHSAFSNLTEHITVREVLGDTGDNKLLRTLGNETIASLPQKINELTVMTVYKEEITFDEHGNIEGKWRYLLTKNGQPTDYKLTELENLILNMQENITKATLNELHTDQMITLQDPTILDKKLLTQISTTITVAGTPITITEPIAATIPENATYGDLTVQQMLDYMTAMFTAVAAFEEKMENLSSGSLLPLP